MPWGVLWCPGPVGCPRGHCGSVTPAEKANATEIRYTKLKEKHSELINTHAELLRKVTLLPLQAGTDTEGSILELNPSLLGLRYPGQS